MSMESLPLLQQAPPPEQQPAVKQSTDPTPDSKDATTEASKQDLGIAPPGTVGSAGAHGDNPHAATATADTIGTSLKRKVGSLQQPGEIAPYPCLPCSALDKSFGCHAEQQGLQLSEGAIYYGLRMLERSGGAMRQHITTENMYEQRLLPEVVSDMACHS